LAPTAATITNSEILATQTAASVWSIAPAPRREALADVSYAAYALALLSVVVVIVIAE
jgi:hypothetical protein